MTKSIFRSDFELIFLTGEWRNGDRHGSGVYFFPNGDKYIGTWQYDVRDGNGTYVKAKLHHAEIQVK